MSFSPTSSRIGGLMLRSLLVGLLAAITSSFQPTDRISEDPLDSFQLAEGFQIELIAQEPLIEDPVAMAVDESGAVYVVEMPGYPLDVSGRGRVKVLLDTDGDGTLDDSRLFADDIVLPTGIMRWKDGILVTAPPDVLFLRDTDGDNKADQREVLLTGFARSNPQHNFNTPLYGLDNWIYLANNGVIWTSAYKEQFGDRGGPVYFPASPDAARLGRNGNNRNVRFRPEEHLIESLSSRSQFGHTFNAWGHHFLVSNATPQFHEVIAARYVDRSSILSASMAMHYTPAYGRNTAIYPITRAPQHQLLTDRGMITSAAGITYYLGGLFPAPYRDVTFIGEPVHNLVHVLSVKEYGATYRAERIEERKEFLASTDSWFRPVNFYIGPDGGLYVVDYHRQIVEHPEWMDEKTASGQLQEGTDKGRIYRITPENTAPAQWMNALSLDEASIEELVDYLESSNIWWRRNAQRLLLDRRDAMQAVPLLESLLSTGDRPEARLHALWTLDGLGAIEPAHVATALTDPHPGVRENALIVSEKFLATSPELQERLFSMADDPHLRVQFQLLCSLGSIENERSASIQRALLTSHIDDPWMQLAALSAQHAVDITYLRSLLPVATEQETEGRAQFLERIASYIADTGTREDVEALAALFLPQDLPLEPSAGGAWWRAALLKGVTAGLGRNSKLAQGPAAFELIPLRDTLLHAFTTTSSAMLRAEYGALLRQLPADTNPALEAALDRAAEVGASDEHTAAHRARALELLAHYSPDRYRPLFESLIDSSEPVDVQLAAVGAFGASDAPEVATTLIHKWPALTSVVRNEALDALMKNQERMQALLSAIEEEKIQRSAIGWHRTVVLMRDTEGVLKTRARALLSEPPGVREEVVQSYASSLDLEGDVSEGRVVFNRVCSTCHQVAGADGVPFGPDLGTVRHWSPEALLAAILIPQQTITDGYGVWQLELNDGSSVAGLIVSESPSHVVVRRLGQEDVSIERERIETLNSLGASAMPAGLEAQLTRREMADLIAYLRFN